MAERWRLVIHGGAGSMQPGRLDPEQEQCARDGLEAALAAGAAILEKRESAIDAVEAAVRVLEEDVCFNAGRGSVLTAEGHIELDAAIVDGARRRAGAVAGLRTTRAPISLARLAMEQGRHVFLSGKGADQFAREHGLEQVVNSWFEVPERRHQLAERVRIGGQSLQQALDSVLADIRELGGKGGLIAVAPNGDMAWGFTTPAMYRGMADAAGRVVAIYSDEDER